MKRRNLQAKNWLSRRPVGDFWRVLPRPAFQEQSVREKPENAVELDDRASLKPFGKEKEAYRRMFNLIFDFPKPTITSEIPTDMRLRSGPRVVVSRQPGMVLRQRSAGRQS